MPPHPEPPHAERQWVPLWWWLVAGALWGTFLVAVFAYVPTAAAVPIALATGAGLAAWLYAWGRTPIEVTPDGIRAGRSLLTWEYAGPARALDAAATRDRLGPGASARAYLVIKPWLREAVEIDVNDAADPHPYWLLGTRDADALARAIEARPGPG